ncbi:type II toxin-antitoxin system VapC family toxin [Devosia sp. PTR5]|uniref:Ribonuclease VapC n=1 Tax=Devosia oryzisoli TaxID=2774138 RepID=A0A927FWM6_9HYPH|nr:type II toxin-antitoxin system VapC family toxin [Devosia oryzisoli]MBD8066877.1 type II toxin-antitoxin system VapC family toxin [Devosia oryzisoli]
MIGIDTNILARIFVDDDPDQRAIAVDFMRARSDADPAFVSAVVLTELVWVLTRTYGLSNTDVRDALEWLFESTNVYVETGDLIRAAVALAARKSADISDCIIVAVAEGAGAAKTVTFDKLAAERIPGMELLA